MAPEMLFCSRSDCARSRAAVGAGASAGLALGLGLTLAEATFWPLATRAKLAKARQRAAVVGRLSIIIKRKRAVKERSRSPAAPNLRTVDA